MTANALVGSVRLRISLLQQTHPQLVIGGPREGETRVVGVLGTAHEIIEKERNESRRREPRGGEVE
jgi:hypothetical protein